MWLYNIFVCLEGTGRESCSHLRFYHRIISFGSRALELQTYGHSKDYQYGFWEMPLIFSFLTEMTLYENYVFTSKARISSVDLPLSPSEQSGFQLQNLKPAQEPTVIDFLHLRLYFKDGLTVQKSHVDALRCRRKQTSTVVAHFL